MPKHAPAPKNSAKMKIKKGDLVQVISGRRHDADKARERGLPDGDRGKQGKVIAVYPESQRVLVEGVNRIVKHTKAGQTARGSQTGGIETMEAPIHVSNVAIVDPGDKKPTRVKTRVEKIERDGRDKAARSRVAVRSGKDL